MIAYCTNVHAGHDLATTYEQIKANTLRVKSTYASEGTMGIGLWLSEKTTHELLLGGQLARFADWLEEKELLPYTLNGFPQGDFHRDVVKHDVYQPDWPRMERLAYTLDLVSILHRLLPEEEEGSISTLPIGFGKDWGEDGYRRSAQQFVTIARELEQLEKDTGRLIYICIEPEPGCVLDTAEDVVSFYQTYLFNGVQDDRIRRYIRVCHDICHSAVMFEAQAAAIKAYQDAGILIGKVQVSAAVDVPFYQMDEGQAAEALEQLRTFNEPKYLHQTMVDTLGHRILHEDLHLALNEYHQPTHKQSNWRVHFHVPIFLEAFGALKSTQADIVEALPLLMAIPELKHYEVETYAWNVLPESMQAEDLPAGIAREIQWLDNQMG